MKNLINLVSAIAILDAIEDHIHFTLISHDSGVAYTYTVNHHHTLLALDEHENRGDRWLQIGQVACDGSLDPKSGWMPKHSTRRKTAEWLFNHKLPSMLKTEDALTGCDFLVNAD